MFRTVPMSIIRSLFTVHSAVVYVMQVCRRFQAGPVCFLSDTFIKILELCQVIVSHFVTLTEDSAVPGSQSSRIVVQRLEEIFCIMEESMVNVLCLCVQKNKNSSVNTRKRN
jgi:hypothetical protein